MIGNEKHSVFSTSSTGRDNDAFPFSTNSFVLLYIDVNRAVHQVKWVQAGVY